MSIQVLHSFGAAAENKPSKPGWSDDHLRTLKIVKLPLDHTDDNISINMGSGRKAGRSWKHNRYNKYSSNIPTAIPKDNEKPCEHMLTHEWANITEEGG